MDFPMSRNFEMSVKTHIEEMMCEAKKERTLVLIRKVQREGRQSILAKPFNNQLAIPDVDLGKCSVYTALWYSRL